MTDDMVLAAGKYFYCSRGVILFSTHTHVQLLSLILYPFPMYRTAEGLAEQVTPEHIEKGLIYPPFPIIRKISANIAARVAAKAYDLGKKKENCLFPPQKRT